MIALLKLNDENLHEQSADRVDVVVDEDDPGVGWTANGRSDLWRESVVSSNDLLLLGYTL